jgi:hypothetical protein
MTAATELDARELLAGRVVDGLTQAMEVFGVYLGVELGLYRVLSELGAATEAELAGHAVPSGEVRLADVIRYCISEHAVIAVRADWQDALAGL